MHKKILRPNLVEMGENETQNWVFCYFLKFDPFFPFNLHWMIAWSNAQLLVL